MNLEKSSMKLRDQVRLQILVELLAGFAANPAHANKSPEELLVAAGRLTNEVIAVYYPSPTG